MRRIIVARRIARHLFRRLCSNRLGCFFVPVVASLGSPLRNSEHVQSTTARTIAPRRLDISILDAGISRTCCAPAEIYEEFAFPQTSELIGHRRLTVLCIRARLSNGEWRIGVLEIWQFALMNTSDRRDWCDAPPIVAAERVWRIDLERYTVLLFNREERCILTVYVTSSDL